MRRFQEILFVSQGLDDEADGLKQALSLARNNQANVHALIVYPGLPPSMERYAERYEVSLQEQLQRSIDSVRESLGLEAGEVFVTILLEQGDVPADRIVRRVIKGGYQLVIKEAESSTGGKGFRALDMDLLRKCPCPVWLCRPILRSRSEICVAVAIDPESTEPANRDLSVSMLKLAREVADTCSGELQVVSCWDYEYESFLRNSSRARMSEAQVLEIVVETRDRHRRALDLTIMDAGIGGSLTIHHLRGKPDRQIPVWVADHQIDILVMGTLARSGLRGFLIGNTAENIVQQLGCSLLALKPGGFVSPVKVY